MLYDSSLINNCWVLWRLQRNNVTLVCIINVFIIEIKSFGVPRYQAMWNIGIIWNMSFPLKYLEFEEQSMQFINTLSKIWARQFFPIYFENWVHWKFMLKDKSFLCSWHISIFFFWNFQYLLTSAFIFLFVSKYGYWFCFCIKGFRKAGGIIFLRKKILL